jgi:hypothetical protein
MRSDFGAGLEAAGHVTGKLTYDPSAPGSVAQDTAPRHGRTARTFPSKLHAVAPGPLTGSLALEGFKLSGGSLTQPIQIAKLILDPAPIADGQPQALATSVAFPAGGSAPLAVTARVALTGYQVTVRGPASLVRIRELAHGAGIAGTAALDTLAGDPATLDLGIEGSWLPTPKMPFSGNAPAGSAANPTPELAVGEAASRGLTGTVTLHNANWKSDSLANHVEISQAVLHLGGAELRWEPVAFSYGPLKGTANLHVPAACEAPEQCPPRLELQFGNLDAGAFQAALLGAHEPGTMISTLLARLRPSSAPAWPRIDGTVKAETLMLGPVTLRDATATLRILPTGAELTAFDASLMGGRLHATGTLANGDKPVYTFTGNLEKLNSEAVCQLLALRCTGGRFDGDGKVDLSGFTGKDLASSAKGALHFEWKHGAIQGHSAPSAVALPPALARFDLWSADAEIANGALTLKQNIQQNQIQRGALKSTVQASVAFGDQPKVTFTTPKESAAAKR